MIETEQMISCGFLGEQEVGKTSLIGKYFKKAEVGPYNPTIAVEVSYGSYQCDDGTRIRIKCWDTSGESKYRGMVCYHLKQVDIVFIVYDISDVISFHKVRDWSSRLKKEGALPHLLYLVGNKTDMMELDASLRRVERQEGEAVARQMGAVFVETSAKQEEKFEFMSDAFEEIINWRAERELLAKKEWIERNKVVMEGELKPGQSVCECRTF